MGTGPLSLKIPAAEIGSSGLLNGSLEVIANSRGIWEPSLLRILPPCQQFDFIVSRPVQFTNRQEASRWSVF